MGLGRYQVVDVNVLPPGQLDPDNESGDTQDLAIRLDVGDPVAGLSLLLTRSDQRLAIEGVAELQQNSADPFKGSASDSAILTVIGKRTPLRRAKKCFV